MRREREGLEPPKKVLVHAVVVLSSLFLCNFRLKYGLVAHRSTLRWHGSLPMLAPEAAAALYSNDDDVTVLTRMSKCTFAAACPVLFSTQW